jgi:hypothetical protein
MNSILVINDCSPEAEHAARFALTIAQRHDVNIIIANTGEVKNVVKVLTSGSFAIGPDMRVLECLLESNETYAGFKPDITELDASAMNEQGLAVFINKTGISMMVKGMGKNVEQDSGTDSLDMQVVLNKVLCPLLLVPEHWKVKDIERIAYIADLRYCRPYIVKYLTQLAAAFDASVSVAHLSAKGLPHIDENYGNSLFTREIAEKSRYDKLFFNNIRERELIKAVDVLVNGMHNDMIAFVNHRYHFEEILGTNLGHGLPEHITVPVLVFPY